uniref:Uncharacterized protein n=1 Tax=Megaselia scalaris TaxID=36166 RepID=T1GY96_MEGSC
MYYVLSVHTNVISGLENQHSNKLSHSGRPLRRPKKTISIRSIFLANRCLFNLNRLLLCNLYFQCFCTDLTVGSSTIKFVSYFERKHHFNHNHELYRLYGYPRIFSLIRTKLIRWSGHLG